jgi:chemotaxis response regulator CheB
MRDTVEQAGGIYVAADATQGTSVINYEQLLQWNPDIIIIDMPPICPTPAPVRPPILPVPVLL